MYVVFQAQNGLMLDLGIDIVSPLMVLRYGSGEKDKTSRRFGAG